MTNEDDFSIGKRLNNNTPYFEITVSFSFCGRATIQHRSLCYNYYDELSINDILGLILYYLKYGNDKRLENEDIGSYVTKFLQEYDLIFDDVICEIDDVRIFYIDRLFCRHIVEFPGNIEIDTVIKKIKSYYHESY